MVSRQKLSRLIFAAGNERSLILIRFVVGLVFLSEGMQKFLFPGVLGPGRFEKIGFSDPAFWAYFTAVFEITCGFLITVGFMARPASFPLFIVMATAFVTTKWPLLITKGFWAFAHEYRTDFAMTLLLIYIFINGAGKWSVDSIVSKYKDT